MNDGKDGDHDGNKTGNYGLAVPPKGPKGVLRITVGGTVEIGGVPCKITHVNEGKRRFTLSPLIDVLLCQKRDPARLAER